MKRLNILLIMGFLFFSSCEDKLELIPYDGLSVDDVLSTANGMDDAMRGVYSAFRADGYYGENVGIMICPDVMSDNLAFNMEGRQTQKELFEWRNTPVDESWETYFRGYRIISRANRILDNIENVEKDAFRDNLQGEALAVRALAHFDIARIYCKIPTQSADAATSMGIPYLESYDPGTRNRRVGTTVQGVYDKVLADLLAAVDLINDDNANGRMDKAAVYGLLSRVYLHLGNDAKVVEYADLAIGLAVPVAPRDEYTNIWVDEYNDNVLFMIRVTDQDNWRPGVPYSQEAQGEIRSEYVVSYELFNLYQATDIRLSGSIITSDFGGNTYNNITKYLGRLSGDKTVIDGKYLRMEEVYLNKAEAHFNLTQEAEALTALNAVRSERYSSFVSPDESGSALEAAIHLERRLELAFEGDRFFHLKRLGLDLSRTADGELADGSGTPAVVQSVLASDFRWQLPIPQGAFDSNPDLTADDQNPGY